MKISKKTIIIIAAILAVGAWLLWRKKESVSTGDSHTPQKSRLEQLIEGAGLNSVEAELVRNFNPTGAYKDWIYTNALENGVDYESSLLLNCLWNRYRNADNTAFQSEAFQTRYQTIANKVFAMNR